MARSKGISYSRLILRNLHSIINVSTGSQKPKIFKDITRFPKPSSTSTTFQARRAFCDLSGNQESPPQPPSSPPSHLSTHWGKWTTGITLTMIIPFLQLKEDVDLVIEAAEEIIDVIEVVAEAVDMVAEKIIDDLPVDSKLKTNMEFVEEVAETIAGKAEKIVEFIDEVQAAEQKLNPVIKPVKQLTQVAPSEAS